MLSGPADPLTAIAGRDWKLAAFCGQSRAIATSRRFAARTNEAQHVRRRRRRGAAMSPRTGMIFLGAAALVLVFGMVYLVNVADHVDPQRGEKRIELPDAFNS
jgi:hypothetical protein